MVWDRDRRGLHDKAAGTVVVVDPNKALQQARSSRAKATAAQPKRPAASARPGKGPQARPGKRKRRK